MEEATDLLEKIGLEGGERYHHYLLRMIDKYIMAILSHRQTDDLGGGWLQLPLLLLHVVEIVWASRGEAKKRALHPTEIHPGVIEVEYRSFLVTLVIW